MRRQTDFEQTPRKTASRYSAAYWRERVFRPTYGKGENRRELSQWYVRVQAGGRREKIGLRTNGKDEAARRAAKLYNDILAKGWESAIAEIDRAKAQAPINKSTVGDVVKVAEQFSEVRANTLAGYVASLRRLAAGVAGIPSDRKKYAAINRGNRTWYERVDAVPLSKLTADAVRKWRKEYVGPEDEVSPVVREKRKLTADSTIRNAKGLFSKIERNGRKPLLPTLKKRVTLPDEFFTEVSIEKSTKRFKASVSPGWLYAEAKKDLEGDRPEVFKALVLVLFLGLRRSEADTLTWSQIDFGQGFVSIARTEYHEPKSEESERDIDMSPDLVATLSRFRAGADPVFVLHGGQARPGEKWRYYRADLEPWETWKRLVTWLRSKGIATPKPIHDLRKMAGSIVHQQHGIEVARGFLGHADIATTSGSYTDKKKKVSVNIQPEPTTMQVVEGGAEG